MKPLTVIVLTILGIFVSASCSMAKTKDVEIQQLIAQKLMIDCRYFCPEGEGHKGRAKAVTELPSEISEAITELGIGGIILFAENLVNTEQILKLNHDIQQAASLGEHTPMLIATDQEGGRVVRLPRNLGTSFSGNMAIGATYDKFDDLFAKQTGEIIAKEMLLLGFNVNFAPTIDVNVNPKNPVINVRSFGEDPQKVAILGSAQMSAMQNQGIIATLKHFPGHGDTSVDSHTGLPRVNHSLEEIKSIDLLPFQYAIDHANPAMIMTAHIQFPKLDNTTFTTKDGSNITLPASMSRKIMTDLLRKKMGFDGVIITDALNMAGISKYFDETEAVIQAFSAGSDIALMPITIRASSDIIRLKKMINDIAKAVQTGRLNKQELITSAHRIEALKKQYQLDQKTKLPSKHATRDANQVIGSLEHRSIEQQLADNAIVMLKNNGALPLPHQIKEIYLSMPDQTKCIALKRALEKRLNKVNITCSSLANIDALANSISFDNADVVIAADISPSQSLAELGDMDNIKSKQQRTPKTVQIKHQIHLLKTAKSKHKTTIFVSLRAPYNVKLVEEHTDAILATFSYNTRKIKTTDHTTTYEAPIYNALADILTGKKTTNGSLPVTIKQ